MRSLLSRVVLGVGIVAALVLGGSAIADAQSGAGAKAASEADATAARKLVDQGIAAQRAKDYDKASELFEEAFALVPHPILLFNVGQAHRLAGRLERASLFYERYLALDPRGPESLTARVFLGAFYFNAALAQLERGQEVEARESLERALRHGEEALGAEQFQKAKQQLRDVERRLGRIHVTCQTAGAEVTLDGETLFVGPGTYRGWVTAKEHELAAIKAGYPSAARRVTISAGELEEIELRVTPSKPAEPDRRWATWKPWAVAAAGGAIVAAGGMFHALSFRNFRIYDEQFLQLPCWSLPVEARGCLPEEIPPALNDRLARARRQQAIAAGGYIVGAAAVAAGAVLVYWNRPRSVEQGAKLPFGGGVDVVPAVSSDMLGILVSVHR